MFGNWKLILVTGTLNKQTKKDIFMQFYCASFIFMSSPSICTVCECVYVKGIIIVGHCLRVWKFCLHEILLTVTLHNASLNAVFNGAKEAVSFMIEE